MKHLYYVGEKIAYLFTTEDGVHLKTDIAIDKALLREGMDLMRQSYNDNIEYEQITDPLKVNDNLFTLTDFQNIMETPNEKNYDKYAKIITFELYRFIKNINSNIDEDNEQEIEEQQTPPEIKQELIIEEVDQEPTISTMQGIEIKSDQTALEIHRESAIQITQEVKNIQTQEE